MSSMVRLAADVTVQVTETVKGTVGSSIKASATVAPSMMSLISIGAGIKKRFRNYNIDL